MRTALLVAFLAACAAPPAEERERGGVAAIEPGGSPEILPEPPDGRPAYAWRLAQRLRATDWRAAWPRRAELPKPEGRYDVAFLWFGGCGCAEYGEVLVDLDDPRFFWLRVTGGILGTREYLGPAEVLSETGPLEFRVVEG